jgi:hypothetical protein
MVLMVSTKELSVIIKVSDRTIRKRCVNLNIKPVGRNYSLTDEDVKRIKNYMPHIGGQRG